MLSVPLFELLNCAVLLSSAGRSHTLSPRPAAVSGEPLCPVLCWEEFDNGLSGEETRNRNQTVLCSTRQRRWCDFAPHGRRDTSPLTSPNTGLGRAALCDISTPRLCSS